MKTAPSELLTAYATGDVNEDEVTAVEKLLAEDPAAREELVSIRQCLAELRAAAPRPEREPAWEEMAASLDRTYADWKENQDAELTTDDSKVVPLATARNRPAAPGATESHARWPIALAATVAVAAAALLLIARSNPMAPSDPAASDPMRDLQTDIEVTDDITITEGAAAQLALLDLGDLRSLDPSPFELDEEELDELFASDPQLDLDDIADPLAEVDEEVTLFLPPLAAHWPDELVTEPAEGGLVETTDDQTPDDDTPITKETP